MPRTRRCETDFSSVEPIAKKSRTRNDGSDPSDEEDELISGILAGEEDALYLLALDIERNGITILNTSAINFFIKDYNSRKKSLWGTRYVSLQRRSVCFSCDTENENGKLRWVYSCGCNKQRSDVVSALSTSLQMTFEAPDVVIYDYACGLHNYCLNREAKFFKHTKFLIDRYHQPNHKGCSLGYKLALYPQFEGLNSQICEQKNSKLARIKAQLSYMNPEHFIQHAKLFLWYSNRKRIASL